MMIICTVDIDNAAYISTCVNSSVEYMQIVHARSNVLVAGQYTRFPQNIE